MDLAAEVAKRVGSGRCADCSKCIELAQEDVSWEACGVFVKQLYLKSVGDLAAQHVHDYDHMTLLAQGTIGVWRDGVYLGERCAPDALTIPAGTAHAFQALEPDTVLYCIHRKG